MIINVRCNIGQGCTTINDGPSTGSKPKKTAKVDSFITHFNCLQINIIMSPMIRMDVQSDEYQANIDERISIYINLFKVYLYN